MLSIDGWLLHATKQPDGSLRLHFQHESCGAAVSLSPGQPNEVVLRCNSTRFQRRRGGSSSSIQIRDREGDILNDDTTPPTTNSLNNVEAADVAQSVVSTLLSSLTSDTKTRRNEEKRPYASCNAARGGRKRRSHSEINDRIRLVEMVEAGVEPAEDEDHTTSANNPNKRRRRWRGEDVRSAVAPASSNTAIDPTLMGMPAEIQLQIFQLVPMLDLLRTVPLVSRQCNDLVRDDGLWRLLKAQYFGSCATRNISFSRHEPFLSDELQQLSPPASPLLERTSYREQCVAFLRELKVLQQKHHRRLYEEERSYRQHQLVWGCSGGHRSFVHDLFRYHAGLIDVDMLSASGNHAERTPLMVAVAAGNDDVASFLLLAKRADVNRATSDGSTPLMIAASKGHRSAVELLLKQGAEVNRITKNGCSALMLAALAGHEDIATLLLERGADPCGKTIDGSTALMIAVSKGNKQIVHSLVQHTPANQRSQVVNETRKDGWTALMIASTKGEEELVRVLVQNGAQVNRRKTGDGCTALMFAAAKGHTEIVRFLLSHNADVNTRNRDGWSALMIAADWGHRECVEAFIEHKHLFTAHNHPFGRVNLRMALIVAFMKKYYDIFTLLLQVGGPQ
jgi:ankyrin repeat protein